jgi:hypothetical protein
MAIRSESSLNDSVDSTSGDTEELGDFCAGVFAAVVEGDEVFFLCL